jgi:DNA-binding IclR family transcriptional regulator
MGNENMARTSAGAQKNAGGPEERQPAYLAPALEKGLDVLELLARASEGLTQSQIAQHLNRSLQEVYRMVVSLERRGYIRRWPQSDAFHLSMKLYDLALAFPPIEMLTAAAAPVLRRLAVEAQQSILVTVMDGMSIRTIAYVDSPAPLGFRVRLGTASPLQHTASGRVLLAFRKPATQKWIFEALADSNIKAAELQHARRRVEAIALHGYEYVADENIAGITDVSFPILDGNGEALAALTMPFLKSVAGEVSIEHAAEFQFKAASELTEILGGTMPMPKVPIADPLPPTS